MKIFIFGLLACFALAASASEFKENGKIENDLKSNGDYTTATVYLANVMSRARRGQYPGSGIIPGKSSKFWLKRCSPCWFAVEKILKPTKSDNEDADLDNATEENEAKTRPTGERKLTPAHCARLMSRVKQDQYPDSGITSGKSAKFWWNKCSPCWYAAKKLLKKKPTKPATENDELDDEDDDVFDMDDLEEDEFTQDPKTYFRRRGGYYGGFYGLPYGGFYGRGYPGYLFG